jgi:2Fe-2S ferredoxin
LNDPSDLNPILNPQSSILNSDIIGSMPRVTFADAGKAGEFPAGKTMLSIAGELGVRVSQVCGGDGACGTCRIEVVEGWDALTPPTMDETYKELEAPYRLSCQSKLLGDVVVRVAKIE